VELGDGPDLLGGGGDGEEEERLEGGWYRHVC
jgi:hypothetical protein